MPIAAALPPRTASGGSDRDARAGPPDRMPAGRPAEPAGSALSGAPACDSQAWSRADERVPAAVSGCEAGLAQRARPRELTFDEEPPPRRLAPYAAAIAATVLDGDAEIGWGRFVLLFDPAGQDGWAGQSGSSPTSAPTWSRRSRPTR